MKFLTLEIQNFGRIEYAKIALDDRGLVLIQGENRDDTSANSNGAGKSSIVEALSWCLYGQTAKRKRPADTIVNRKHKKNCHVSVLLQDDDGTTVRVDRYRKHKTHKNETHLTRIAADGTETAIGKGTEAATQPEIDAVLGCEYDVFVAAIYAGQEKMPDLPLMTDKQLKSLIEEAAGLTELDRAYDLAKQKLGDAQEKLVAHKMVVQRAEDAVTSASNMVESVSESVRIWESERKARLVDLQTDIRVTTDSIKTQSEGMKKLTPISQIEEERAKNAEAFEKIDAEKDKLRELSAIVSERSSDLSSKKSTAEHYIHSCRSLKSKLDGTKSMMGEPCTSCGRNHDEDSLSASIKAATKDLAECTKKMRAARADYETAKEAHLSAVEARDAFERTMTDTTHLVRVSEAISQRERATTDAQNELDRLKKEARRLLDVREKEKTQENPHVERLEEAKKKAALAKENLSELKAETKALEREVDIAGGVARVFSPKGIRAHILDTVTPFLNKQTAIYLGAMSDGRFQATWSTLKRKTDGSFSERFSIAATDTVDGGDFEDMSGGERRKVRIATALALQDLVATRATKKLEIWVGDEIDAALDPSGLERLMVILSEKARERGTVLVISHSDLRDWVPNTITLVREDDVSRIE